MSTIPQGPSYPAVSLDYISAAANRFSRTAQSSDSSLIAFGSSTFVALWLASEDDGTGVYQTLPGHDGLVTCVRFIDEDVIVSADDKGSLRYWRKVQNKWVTAATSQAHSRAISALGTYKGIVVTGASDSSVAVWKYVQYSDETSALQEIQRIDLKNRYPLDIQLTTLPDTDDIVMAVSGTEKNINIYTMSDDKFIKVATLQGHEDWIKSLAFKCDISGAAALTLASGSQDGTIRLWNIERYEKDKKLSESTDELSDDLLDSFEASLGELADEEGGRQISLKRHIFATKGSDGRTIQYTITFDALLIGHEAGVTSLAWRPSLEVSSTPVLLSTSVDSSVILWSPTDVPGSQGGKSTSLWINQQRFGDVGGQRLGGFVGALWARGGREALGWGWAGGWRRWRSEVSELDPSRETWREVNAISGHNGIVQSVSWSTGGELLISSGPDQTTRIHGNTAAETGAKEQWHEICRPQVHGYDLVDSVFLSPTRFVSIADEKVARVFDAPQSFIILCKNLKILPNTEDLDEAPRPVAASVPPLGLSNKALSGADQTESHFPLPSIQMTKRRPFEGELALSTLWPESEKLFGHGYELHAIAASHSGKYIATSCRATTPEHAGIKVYDTKSWQQFGQTLQGHQLTVTRIAFSHDDKYILSVSRDRTWRLFEASDVGYVALKAEKPHARIVWDCAWAKEQYIFATASRDKTVKVWDMRNVDAEKQIPSITIKTKEPVTSVAISEPEDDRHLLAIGLENGEILIYTSPVENPTVWEQQLSIDNSIGHVKHIHRMAWRPCGERKPGSYQLASCGEDGSLRLIRIQLQPVAQA